jgi:integrase
LARTKVPLLNRLFYGFLAREGLRASEARDLLVSDIDLERGVCNLDANKTDDPRAWVLSSGCHKALQQYLQRYRPGAHPGELLFLDPSGRRPPGDNLARALRRDLKTALVKRSQLFADNEERIHIRGHDLRATFVTIHLAIGKTETWIADRTGHKSTTMIARYRRQARTHADLNLGELTPLSAAIPELATMNGSDVG